MCGFLKRTWAEIDLDALKYNFMSIRKKIPEKSKIMCVVKADAYGHGAKFIARELEEYGADWFSVSNIEEAMELRNYGVKKPILVLGYTPEYMVDKLNEYDISQAVLSSEYANKIIQECKKRGIKTKVHIKIDTGMNRIGFAGKNDDEINKTVDEIVHLCGQSELIVEGAFTHFSVADEPQSGEEYTEKQYFNFMRVLNSVEERGIKIPLRHCSNSGNIIQHPEMSLDMVRAGIILYGLYPSAELKGKIDLKPVMQLKTVISQLKKVSAGASVSYGRTFVTAKETSIATVPIGYADGYLRGFSNCAKMIVNGKRVPVIGRVCMDQLMLDVSDIPDLKEGALVTVFGVDGKASVSVDELATILKTINYEIVCLIGRRVPRIYFKNGRNIGKLNYMFC